MSGIRKLSLLLLLIVLIIGGNNSSIARDKRLSPKFLYASVNVPLHHWSYEALEKLFVAKLIDAAALSTKPLTRMEMAILVKEAIEKAQSEELQVYPSPIYLEDLLVRLISEFQEELTILGADVPQVEGRKEKKFFLALPESLRITNTYDELGRANRKRADNQQGEYRYDGYQTKLEARAWARLPGAALCARPFLRYSDYEYRDEVRSGLKEAYLNLSLYNFQVEVGKDSLWWGPGYHGSLLLSDHAAPFKMVKLSNRKPFRFPWVFRYLGRWKTVFFLTQLEENRTVPEPKLGGIRLEVMPCSFLSIGASRTVMLGGKGRPSLSFGDYWKVFLANKENVPGKLDNNQLASLDFRLRFFGTEFYGEFGGEDEAGYFPSICGYLGGIFIPNFLRTGMDIRTEVARNDSTWYKHHGYISGYTYKGFNMGHHMGSDAEDIFFRLSRQWTEKVASGFTFDREKRGRSLSYPEIESEAGLDFSFQLSKNFNLTTAYYFENIKNYRHNPNQTAKNHTGILGLNINF